MFDNRRHAESPSHPKFAIANFDLSPHPPSPEGGLRRTRAGRGRGAISAPRPGKSGSVFCSQRPIIGAIRHPAARKGNVTAILRIHRKELHHLAVTCAVLDRE